MKVSASASLIAAQVYGSAGHPSSRSAPAARPAPEVAKTQTRFAVEDTVTVGRSRGDTPRSARADTARVETAQDDRKAAAARAEREADRSEAIGRREAPGTNRSNRQRPGSLVDLKV